MISDREILDLPWEELPPERRASREKFVFVSVDVIGHSKLIEEAAETEQLLEQHNLLMSLRTYVRLCFQDPWLDDNGLEWAWAGDGGIYAYPTRWPELYVEYKMLLIAERIVDGMTAFNATHSPSNPIELRIVLDYGEGLRYHEREVRRSAAMNFVAKLRVPGERTSIAITKELLDLLVRRHPDRKLLARFRRIDVSDQTKRQVYAHLRTMEDALRKEIVATGQTDVTQASHLAYRLGVLYLGTNERERAIKEFQSAVTWIDKAHSQHRYYYRTIREFYSLWIQLAIDIPESALEAGDAGDRRQMLRRLKENRFFEAYDLPNAWDLLLEMEFCIEQLDILARRPVSDPIGLTSLQICLLLERVGYPRRWHGAAISLRIRRIDDELEESKEWVNEENGPNVDMACGLCSAVAASCLALDTRDSDLFDSDFGDRKAKERVAALVTWLASKRSADYCYRGRLIESRAPSNEHAMHYAASVLQAFVDHDLKKNASRINVVLDKFFHGISPNAEQLPPSWVKHRNISTSDYCGHVFPAFARLIIARRGISKTHGEVMKSAVEVLVALFQREADEGGLNDNPGRLYAARDNLGAFGLGLLVGLSPGAVKLFGALRKGMAAVSNDLLPEQQRKRTIDSNLDRIRKWLDGWLLQWECALYLRDSGSSFVPAELEELFATRPQKKPEKPVPGERSLD